MLKHEIIETMSKHSNGKMTYEDSEIALIAFCKTVEEAIGNCDNIKLTGYFTIYPKKLKSKIGRNLKTNTPIILGERYKLRIRAGKKLLDAERKINSI